MRPHSRIARTWGAGGAETILIAEDDAMVRSLMKEVLEEHGYRELEAKDGEQAVRVFREGLNGIQLVILDTIMPRMNGKQVSNAIKAVHPGIKVLFMSGCTADIIDRQGLAEQVFELMQKPVTPAELAARVRRAIDT